jgi:hypothetical protein
VQNPPGVAAPPSAYKTFAELQRLVPFHAPDLTAANKQFFAFDIAASNYSLTLNNLSFLASHEFNSGGRDDDVLFTVYVDTHSNFSSPTYVYQTYITNITANYFVPLSGIVSDSIPPKLYFRIYLNDGGTYSGPEKVRVDNVTLVGTSVPAPEPATMCIWAVGAGLALVVGGVRKRFGIA